MDIYSMWNMTVINKMLNKLPQIVTQSNNQPLHLKTVKFKIGYF